MAKAELNRVPLAEALRDLHLRRSTGELHVRRGVHEKVLTFLGGEIVAVRTNLPDEKLDKAVLQWGLIDEEDLEKVKAQAGDTPLEDALRESDGLRGEEFDDFLKELRKEWALELFLWTMGEIEFEKDEGSSTEPGSAILSVPDLIVEGVRRSASFDGVRERLVWADPVLSINDQPPIAMDEVHIHSQEGYLFSLVDGSSTIKQVLTLSPLGEEETLRLIYAFLVLGLINSATGANVAAEGFFTIRRFGQEEEKKAERMEDMVFKLQTINERLGELDHWQVMGLDDSATMEDINTAYQALIKKYMPERFPPEVQKKCRREIELINGRIGTAYLELTEQGMDQATGGSGSRPGGQVQRLRSREEIEADRAVAHEAAVQMLSRARDAELQQDFHKAIQYAEQAIQTEPDLASHHTYLARLLQHNPAWMRRAEASLKKAIELDSENPTYHWELAQLYIRGNHIPRAREQLQIVAELEPQREAEIKKMIKRLK